MYQDPMSQKKVKRNQIADSKAYDEK